MCFIGLYDCHTFRAPWVALKGCIWSHHTLSELVHEFVERRLINKLLHRIQNFDSRVSLSNFPKITLNQIYTRIMKHHATCNMMLTITCDDDPFWLHILFHPGVTQWRITAASQIRACDLQRLSGFCWLFVHRCVVHTWVFFTCPHHRIPCDKVTGLL